MTTKDQERKAVEKIRKIVEELGENSYVGFAMEGGELMAVRTQPDLIAERERSTSDSPRTPSRM